MSRNKMTRDTIPENFTLGLAVVDALPVLFFCGSMILAGVLLRSALFLFGALLCFFAGAAKVLWKVIVVLRRKNIWWLFLQMRVLMPIGLVLMIIGAFNGSGSIHAERFLASASGVPAVLFGVGILGMGLMLFFAFRLDSSDVRANWIEQITNGIAQAAFFLALLMITVRLMG